MKTLPNKTMPPPSNDRLAEHLAIWFGQRGGAWSGTVAELLTAVRAGSSVGSSLWPDSGRGLYDHLNAQRETLRSLGVDVLLCTGIPRMVSLRSCAGEPAPEVPSSPVPEIDPVPSPPSNLSMAPAEQATPVVGSEDTGSLDTGSPDSSPVAYEAIPKEILRARSEAARYTSAKYTLQNAGESGIFVDTAEALVAIGEMRQRIQERDLDLQSAVDFVIGTALRITRSHSIAVGFLPEKPKVRGALAGARASMKGLHFDANLFPSRLVAGETVQLPDAQKDAILGSKFRREGVGSLIIVPIFHGQKVEGAMEFLFHEKLNFSPGDVMDLGLIAGVIGDSLDDVAPGGVNHGERYESAAERKALDTLELPFEQSSPQNAPAETESSLPRSVRSKPPASAKLSDTPAVFWRGLKKTWTRHSGGK